MKKYLIISLLLFTTTVFGQVEENEYIIINDDTTTYNRTSSSWDSSVFEKRIKNISINSPTTGSCNSIVDSIIKDYMNKSNVQFSSYSDLDSLYRANVDSNKCIHTPKELKHQKILQYGYQKKSRDRYIGRGGVVVVTHGNFKLKK